MAKQEDHHQLSPDLEAGSTFDEKDTFNRDSNRISNAPTLYGSEASFNPKASRRNTMASFRTVDEEDGDCKFSAEDKEQPTEAQAAEAAIEESFEPGVCPTCRNPAPGLKNLEKPPSRTQSSESEKDKEEPAPHVTWDGPDDPANPHNMTELRKWAIVVATGLMTFCVSFASSVFTTTTFVLSAKFHVSDEVMLLGLALYVCGFAVGPLIWGPMSEAYGRTRPMFFGMFVFCVFQIPVAVAQNLETIFLCRFLAGTFGAAPLAIVVSPNIGGLSQHIY